MENRFGFVPIVASHVSLDRLTYRNGHPKRHLYLSRSFRSFCHKSVSRISVLLVRIVSLSKAIVQVRDGENFAKIFTDTKEAK